MYSTLRALLLPTQRADRPTFLIGLIVLYLCTPLLITLPITFLSPIVRATPLATPVVFLGLTLLAIWPVFCLYGNRLHDIGRSAFWAVLPLLIPTAYMISQAGVRKEAIAYGFFFTFIFAPMIYAVFALFLLFFPGPDGPNRFGSRPPFR